MKYTTMKVDWGVWDTVRPSFRKNIIDGAIRASPQIYKPVIELIPHDLWLEIRVIPGR